MIILLQRGVSIARFVLSTSLFFVLKKAAYIRCKAAWSTWKTMEAGSLTIFLYALFIFSAEGKVYKHLIVRSHFMLVFIDKSEIMT